VLFLNKEWKFKSSRPHHSLVFCRRGDIANFLFPNYTQPHSKNKKQKAKIYMNLARKYLKLLYDALDRTVMHDGIEHAGYMAFLSLLSIFPFLVFLMAITGFFGETTLGESFIDIIFTNLPEDFTTALKPRMIEIISGPPQGLLTVSIVGAIWTASSSVEGLRTILNRAYRIKTPPAYIWRRLLSIVQFLALTGIIIVAMFLLVVLPIIYSYLDTLLQLEGLIENSQLFDPTILKPISSSFRTFIVFVTLFMVVSALYCILPNAKIVYKSVIPGSIVVVLLWYNSGALLISYFRDFEQVNVIYGSLGGIIASLLFFYVINLIFIFGAEYNYLLRKRK
jgi:membrane protein